MADKKKATLEETGKKVGKALARSAHTVEETGMKMKKATEKLMKEAGKKAEKTVESAVDLVKKEMKELAGKKTTGTKPETSALFKPGKDMTVEGQIGFLAGDIFEHLAKHGPTPVAEMAKIEKKANPALFGAALGWLAREAKISFSSDGAKIYLL